MPLVPVDATELHRAAVEPALPVLDLAAAEPDPEADVPGRAGQDRGIQAGMFVRPGLGVDAVRDPGLGGGEAEFGDRHYGRAIRVDPQDAGVVLGVVVGADEEVPDPAGRLVDNRHAAEDA